MLVRCYLAYVLSYRHVRELALERGLKVYHSTVLRWLVIHPLLLEENFRRNHKTLFGQLAYGRDVH